ncbi:helix-turn-helix transcriptional regulator [Flavobacterium granuli]|uniref:Transcriptional regulator with XRE-family HTH domain n=1 Tax=Flavobacterium granuli TaxID=280093 RepID=A0ABU1S3S3_9FLAO|nr:helix-turn-helix transcriptional regulator [Flavobacterium granuli]MDR6845676.1 transcriptional regulator with XRE-family HTH domain [Flavobacterium granuli]
MINIKLREVRLNKGLSQQELADLIGMTQCNYSRRENGKKSISDIEWTRIAKSLEVNREEIYESNIHKTNNNNITNLHEFYIPSFILNHLEFLKNENAVLKERLKAFDVHSK